MEPAPNIIPATDGPMVVTDQDIAVDLLIAEKAAELVEKHRQEFMNNVTDLIQYLGEFEQGRLLMVLREKCIEIIPRSSLMLYDVQLDMNNFLR